MAKVKWTKEASRDLLSMHGINTMSDSDAGQPDLNSIQEHDFNQYITPKSGPEILSILKDIPLAESLTIINMLRSAGAISEELAENLKTSCWITSCWINKPAD